MKNQVTVSFPAYIGYLEMCMDNLNYFCESNNFDSKETKSLQIAFEEALSNTIRHSYQNSGKELIKLEFQTTVFAIKITIHDRGLPFDDQSLPDYHPEELDIEDEPGGLGLFLLKKYADEVSFKNLGVDGREIIIEKYKSSDIKSSEKNTDQVKTGKTESKKDVKFVIRRMKDEEAIKIAQTVYYSYGYSYHNEHLYFPERVINMNKSGHLMTAVAIADDGIFAGTAALYREEPGDKIAKIGEAFVRPEYRKNSCFLLLSDFLVEEARENGITGIYSQSLTNHVLTQKTALKLGFRDCAIKLAYCSESLQAEDSPDESNHRESALIQFKNLADSERKPLYIPEHHKQIILEIYENLDIKPHISSPRKTNLNIKNPKTTLSVKLKNRMNMAELKIEEYGLDVVELLYETKNDLCAKKIDVIYLSLNLSDMLTYKFLPRIEELGFFFSGILPGYYPEYAIILQYLNNVKLNFDKIKLETDFAIRLLNYLKHVSDKNPIRMLVNQGESDVLEFKSTIRWNLEKKKKDSNLEFTIMKTIVAFLNTMGGTLFVGVNDSGEAIGLPNDGFRSEDDCMLHVKNLIKKYIGIEFFQFISYRFVNLVYRHTSYDG